MHKTMSLISLHTSRFIATPKHSEPLSPKHYICVVALSTDLLRVSLHVVIEFLHYSPTIELLLLLIPINRFYLSSAGLFTILEILISIVADTVRRFMQDRLAGRYLRTYSVARTGNCSLLSRAALENLAMVSNVSRFCGSVTTWARASGTHDLSF